MSGCAAPESGRTDESTRTARWAHDRKVQPHRCFDAVFLSSFLGGQRLCPCFLQIGAHELAEVRQLDFGSLAPKQIASAFPLRPLNGACERRLRDMALPCRLCEVQLLADRKEIRDLIEFHARQKRYFEFNVAMDDHVSSVPV